MWRISFRAAPSTLGPTPTWLVHQGANVRRTHHRKRTREVAVLTDDAAIEIKTSILQPNFFGEPAVGNVSSAGPTSASDVGGSSCGRLTVVQAKRPQQYDHCNLGGSPAR